MATWRVAMISVWLFGCTWADAPSGQPVDASHRTRTSRWREIMRGVDEACADLDRCLLRKPQGDMLFTAERAGSAAERLGLGYRELQDVTVPGFETFARDAESWLLRIAIEARQGHGDIAADLYRTGRERHCTRCHEANQRVHG